MAYQTVTTRSYGQRVGDSFKGIGAGFLMFIAGTVLLWWNEGRTVKTDDMLNEAQANTEIVESVAKINPDLEGKLIHATAKAETTDSISDPEYPVGGVAINIRRTVEYYQWVEHEKTEKRDKLGGGEETIHTYTYEKKWVSSPVNSSTFADPAYQGRNTVRKEVEDNVVYNENVTFGAYKLPQFFVSSISGSKPAMLQVPGNTNVSHDALDAAADSASADQAADQAEDAADGRVLAQTETPVTGSVQYKDYVVNGNMVYYGDPTATQIGDVRITFTRVDPAVVSILGRVQGETFSEYVAKNGKKFSRLEMGTKSSDEMYQSAHDENDMIKWALRILGILLVVGGLKGIFGILTTLLKVVPFLASIMNFGVGLICWVLGLTWSFIVIGVAWLFYRPVAGIIMLALAGALVAWLVIRGKNKKPELQPAPVDAQGPQDPQGPQGGQQY
ncbi:MAG: TMEM43 family protein, partial [Muribaculaceae bacterium]|nr:TMEM43 family protein [Muribaculaceae bacterium]